MSTRVPRRVVVQQRPGDRAAVGEPHGEIVEVARGEQIVGDHRPATGARGLSDRGAQARLGRGEEAHRDFATEPGARASRRSRGSPRSRDRHWSLRRRARPRRLRSGPSAVSRDGEHLDQPRVGAERRRDRDTVAPGGLLPEVDAHVVAGREQQRDDDDGMIRFERVEGCRDVGLLHVDMAEAHGDARAALRQPPPRARRPRPGPRVTPCRARSREARVSTSDPFCSRTRTSTRETDRRREARPSRTRGPLAGSCGVRPCRVRRCRRVGGAAAREPGVEAALVGTLSRPAGALAAP